MQALGYILVPAVLYFVYYILFLVFGLPELDEQLSTLLFDVLTLISIVYFFSLYKKERWQTLFSEKLKLKKLLALVPLSFLVRVPLLIVVVCLVLIFGDTAMNTIDEGINYQWEGFSDLSGWGYIVAILSFSIIGPIHEELFFRGIVFNGLKKYYSIKASIMYSTVIFALFHLHPGLIPSSFILGIFLVLVYHKWNNLTYSIILHMLINLHPFLLELIVGKV